MTSTNTHLLGRLSPSLARGWVYRSEAEVREESGLLAQETNELLGRSRFRQFRDGRLWVVALAAVSIRRSSLVARLSKQGKAGLKCRGTGLTGFLKLTASLLLVPQSAQHWPGFVSKDKQKEVFCTPVSQCETVRGSRLDRLPMCAVAAVQFESSSSQGQPEKLGGLRVVTGRGFAHVVVGSGVSVVRGFAARIGMKMRKTRIVQK